MKHLIDYLAVEHNSKHKNPVYSKWQKVALQIIEQAFHYGKFVYFDNDKGTTKSPEIKTITDLVKFLDECFATQKKHDLVKDWGCWLNLKLHVTMTEKQDKLVQGNLRAANGLFNGNVRIADSDYYFKPSTALSTDFDKRIVETVCTFYYCPSHMNSAPNPLNLPTKC